MDEFASRSQVQMREAVREIGRDAVVPRVDDAVEATAVKQGALRLYRDGHITGKVDKSVEGGVCNVFLDHGEGRGGHLSRLPAREFDLPRLLSSLTPRPTSLSPNSLAESIFKVKVANNISASVCKESPELLGDYQWTVNPVKWHGDVRASFVDGAGMVALLAKSIEESVVALPSIHHSSTGEDVGDELREVLLVGDPSHPLTKVLGVPIGEDRLYAIVVPLRTETIHDFFRRILTARSSLDRLRLRFTIGEGQLRVEPVTHARVNRLRGRLVDLGFDSIGVSRNVVAHASDSATGETSKIVLRRPEDIEELRRAFDEEVKRVLHSTGWFAVLGLEEVDSVTDDAVQKAYRKCSKLTDPSKNPHPGAFLAFEA
ncbi:hypothetical protein BDK51DRAFT_34465, partial [Blyttiomyces helicus]